MRRALAFLLLAALPVPAAVADPFDSAPYLFSVAKLLAAEGEYAEALATWARAVEAAPEDPYVRLEYGELLFRLGRTDRALEQLEAAEALAPGNPDVLSLAARVHLDRSDEDPAALAAAEERLERLLELRPDDLLALRLLARLHQSQGRLAEAEEAARRLVALQPGQPPAAALLLSLLVEQGKSREAEALLRDVLARVPDAFEMRLTLADLLSERDAHAEAVAVLEGAPEEQRGHSELRRRLGAALLRAGRPEAARQLFDRLVADDPQPRLRMLRALLLADLGDRAAAEAELRRLHQELPGDAMAATHLARILVQEGRHDEGAAVLEATARRLAAAGEERSGSLLRVEGAQLLAAAAAWEELLELIAPVRGTAEAPLREAASLIAAEALSGLGRDEEALAALPAAPTAPELLARRAEILFRLGRGEEAEAALAPLWARPDQAARLAEVYQRSELYERAIPVLERLLEEQPGAVVPRFWLGAAYERSGRHAEAEAAFRELLAARPDFHMALNYLGYMWAEQGTNLGEAQQLIERALALDPENPAYVDSLGWVYYRQGRLREALDQLERAADLLPEDGTVQEHLGDVHRALGNRREARNAYRRALDLEDTSPALREKLEQVERDLGNR